MGKAVAVMQAKAKGEERSQRLARDGPGQRWALYLFGGVRVAMRAMSHPRQMLYVFLLNHAPSLRAGLVLLCFLRVEGVLGARLWP